MCGRYSIYEPMDHYLKELAPEQLVIIGHQWIRPLANRALQRCADDSR